MKITRLEILRVPPSWVWLKIHTDEGLVGLGEPYLEGHPDSVIAEVRAARAAADRARPAADRGALAATCTRAASAYKGGPVTMSAISGIDIALWDIAGKAAGVPIHQMLGGACRDRVKLYRATGGELPRCVEPGASRAGGRPRSERPGRLGRGGARAGPGVGLPLPEGALRARRRAGGDRAHRLAGRAVRGRARGRRAGGRRGDRPAQPAPERGASADRGARSRTGRCSSRSRCRSSASTCCEQIVARRARADRRRRALDGQVGLLRRAAAAGALAVVQPDICHAGGITECKKIAAMAEAAYAKLALHCPLSPLALAASSPARRLPARTSWSRSTTSVNDWREDGRTCIGRGYFADPFVLDDDGCVAVPTGPGLGVELDEDGLAAIMAGPGAAARLATGGAVATRRSAGPMHWGPAGREARDGAAPDLAQLHAATGLGAGQPDDAAPSYGRLVRPVRWLAWGATGAREAPGALLARHSAGRRPGGARPAGRRPARRGGDRRAGRAHPARAVADVPPDRPARVAPGAAGRR